MLNKAGLSQTIPIPASAEARHPDQSKVLRNVRAPPYPYCSLTSKVTHGRLRKQLSISRWDGSLRPDLPVVIASAAKNTPVFFDPFPDNVHFWPGVVKLRMHSVDAVTFHYSRYSESSRWIPVEATDNEGEECPSDV